MGEISEALRRAGESEENSDVFVDETVASVLDQSYKDFEIIIVNDGSTDAFTNNLLADYSQPRTSVIRTENQGLASARNNGIEACSGDYILPLDADDKIGPEYLKEAVGILSTSPEVGIVYCRALLFGAVETEWKIPEYSLQGMLIDNLIFCSALFRKTDWEKVGGYDPGMIYGWEDYDFWLSLIEVGREVYRLDDTHFHYRVASNSMVRSKEKWQKAAMFKRIFERHTTLFHSNINVWIDAILDTRGKYYTSRLYVDTGSGFNDTESIARKVETGTRELSFELSNFTNINAIRFDPVDTSAVVEFEAVHIKKKDGTYVGNGEISANALFVEDNLLYFDTTDPRCFFPDIPVELLNDCFEITINLKFHAFDDQALHAIIEHQKKKGTLTEKGKTSLTRIKRRYLDLFSGT